MSPPNKQTTTTTSDGFSSDVNLSDFEFDNPPEQNKVSHISQTSSSHSDTGFEQDLELELNSVDSEQQQPQSHSDTAAEPARYPPQLVIRILSSMAFKNSDTRISAEALDAVAEYLRIFTREAVWRSENERRLEITGAEGTGLGENKQNENDNRMLQVRHLTKISSDLILDF